jgi:hypothetical protein
MNKLKLFRINLVLPDAKPSSAFAVAADFAAASQMAADYVRAVNTDKPELDRVKIRSLVFLAAVGGLEGQTLLLPAVAQP